MEKALSACGGNERHIPTKVLAGQIVNARLKGDFELSEKTYASGTEDTLVSSEMTRLRRQAKDKVVKGETVKGILHHLMVDAPDAKNLLWHLPTKK